MRKNGNLNSLSDHCEIKFELRIKHLTQNHTTTWKLNTWHIYTMEYYAAIKKDEFMSFARTWMNLKIIILNKLTQEQTPHVFIHKWVLDNENTWTQGEEHHTLGSVGQ